MRSARIIVPALLLVAAIVAGAAFWQWGRNEPRRVAEQFLDALVEGDFDAALELAGPDPERDPAFHKTIRIAPEDGTGITGYAITGVERTGDWFAEVEVVIESGGDSHPATFNLNGVGGDPSQTRRDWRVSYVNYPSVQFTADGSAEGLVVNGKSLSFEDLGGQPFGGFMMGGIDLMPGTYTFDLPARGEFVTPASQTITLAPDFGKLGFSDKVTVGYELTPEGHAEVIRLMDEQIAECIAAERVTPACSLPMGEGWDRGTWQVFKSPTLRVEKLLGFGWEIKVDEPGIARFTVDPEVGVGSDGAPLVRERPLRISGWFELQPDGTLVLTNRPV